MEASDKNARAELNMLDKVIAWIYPSSVLRILHGC